ncbi:hypothetical protein SH580_03175 [Coraliomargarita algicola]|uniref:Verru_Chthon cassette protein A n=1 Tax=Coraliomargarita algicola TaxID=3092156 RepID=A0ABZ0RKH5_9BACT|nr:hypothetical protein [Coraliomargarita sp. J2-16]WPJ96705.1 hypothetical protein SH580_03175 [Coraliomargarita sp. J2-16]
MIAPIDLPTKASPHPHAQARSKPQALASSGFALVIALSLMAFVVLLMLTLSTMLQVESQSSHISKQQTLAEQNALLALNVAIGSLQKHVGVDSISTASSSMLDTDPTTAEIEGQNEWHWTGVWGADGSETAWLVSGNEGRAISDTNYLTPASNNENFVKLTSDRTVSVPTVELANGQYAYWVGDESTKAKITHPSVQSGSNALQTAGKIDISQQSELAWTQALSNNLRSTALNLNTLSIGASNETESTSLITRQHDLTAHSYGLLTNSKSGGLKQDLTLSLFAPATPPSGQIFPPLLGTSATDADPGGPPWEQLASWVASSPASGSDLPVRPQTNTQTGIFPVVTQLQYYWLPQLGPGPDYKIYIQIMPAVTLWNPYDRALESTDYRLDIGQSFRNATVANDFRAHRFLFHGTELELDPQDYYTPDHIDSSVSGNRRLTSLGKQALGMRFNIPNVRLEPGQAITFSPVGNQELQTFGDAYDAASNSKKDFVPAPSENQLAPGYRSEASFYIDSGRQLSQAPNPTLGDPRFYIAAHLSPNRSYRLLKQDDDEGTVLTEAFGLSGNKPEAAPFEDFQTFVAGNPVIDKTGSTGFKSSLNLVQAGYDESVSWLAHLNPRAAALGPVPFLYHDRDLLDIKYDRLNNPSVFHTVYVDGNEQDTGMPILNNEAGIGYSHNEQTTNRAILFESPPARDALFSIGQLMHAPLYNRSIPADTIEEIARYRLSWARFDNFLPAYAIGSSKADPYIPLDSLSVDWADYPPRSGTDFDSSVVTYSGQHVDYAYLLNQALWDAYFFSSLPSSVSRQPSNKRIIALDPYQTDTLASNDVAAHFVIDGAFNINSTSEDAWRSQLATFFGESLHLDQPEGSPFLRVHDNPGEPFHADSDDEYDDAAYHGYRTLNSDQIANLAHQIVKQIKWRGPFTSLAQFINRSPDRDAPTTLDVDAFRLSGALDAALSEADAITATEATELGIDINQATINKALISSSVETTPQTAAGFIEKAQEGWRTESIPGWLSQPDLLARLGAIFTTRSDTFKIRVMGQSDNQVTGESVTVYAEAIIQRLPEFINTIDSADTPLDSLSAQENARFGRRLALVDFKWIPQP